MTLAAFAFLLRPYKAIAEPDTQIGGGTDLTRTLKLDNKSAEWDAIVEKLSIQRQVQEERKQEEERIAAEVARKKAEAEAIAAKVKAETATQQKATLPKVVISGTATDWLRAAGIPEADWEYVNYIVSRESGWDPCAYNPGQHNCGANPTSACGLVQQNPCHKIPGDWRDPVAALMWQKVYVCSAKFNVFPGATCYQRAVNYWKAHGNY